MQAVKLAVETLINKIIEKRKEKIMTSLYPSRITLYTDHETVFKHNYILKTFLNEHKIILHQIGTPKVTHNFSVERVIRTVQERLGK